MKAKTKRLMGGYPEPDGSLTQAGVCDSGRTSGPLESLHEWFEQEILSQEQALRRYLARSWRDRAEIDDLRQETYVRVYESAARSRPLLPRSFLFATARHLMTDRIRRQRVVAMETVGDLDTVKEIAEERSPETCAAIHEELQRLAEAIDALPPKCREVVWLRRVDELPQRQVASQLGITQKTVEKHVMKGMKRLAQAIREPNSERK